MPSAGSAPLPLADTSFRRTLVTSSRRDEDTSGRHRARHTNRTLVPTGIFLASLAEQGRGDARAALLGQNPPCHKLPLRLPSAPGVGGSGGTGPYLRRRGAPCPRRRPLGGGRRPTPAGEARPLHPPRAPSPPHPPLPPPRAPAPHTASQPRRGRLSPLAGPARAALPEAPAPRGAAAAHRTPQHSAPP